MEKDQIPKSHIEWCTLGLLKNAKPTTADQKNAELTSANLHWIHKHKLRMFQANIVIQKF